MDIEDLETDAENKIYHWCLSSPLQSFCESHPKHRGSLPPAQGALHLSLPQVRKDIYFHLMQFGAPAHSLTHL